MHDSVVQVDSPNALRKAIMEFRENPARIAQMQAKWQSCNKKQ